MQSNLKICSRFEVHGDITLLFPYAPSCNYQLAEGFIFDSCFPISPILCFKNQFGQAL